MAAFGKFNYVLSGDSRCLTRNHRTRVHVGAAKFPLLSLAPRLRPWPRSQHHRLRKVEKESQGRFLPVGTPARGISWRANRLGRTHARRFLNDAGAVCGAGERRQFEYDGVQPVAVGLFASSVEGGA